MKENPITMTEKEVRKFHLNNKNARTIYGPYNGMFSPDRKGTVTKEYSDIDSAIARNAKGIEKKESHQTIKGTEKKHNPINLNNI